MTNWDKIQQEMDHVAQFRALTEDDWNHLCSRIQQEILTEQPRNKVTKPSFMVNDPRQGDRRAGERRAGDRRQSERRDYGNLVSVSDTVWETLCHRIRTLTKDERQSADRKHDRRAGNDRRQGDRRNDERRNDGGLN